MLAQFIAHIFSDPFLLGCASVMVALTVLDLYGLLGRFVGFKNARQFDFKTPIVSIGLFGTFFGVLVGLYGFDTKDITKSVPHLLEGLKFAFAISVLGMFLSLSLSIIEKFTGQVGEDADVLRSIEQKMGSLLATIEAPSAMVREFREMKSFLKEHLGQINSSLEKALLQLAKGATSEVIQALQTIITEFNKNLEDQFGENFKELNVACHKLVQWQEKYRAHVDSTEAHLNKIIIAMDEARAAAADLVKRSEATADVCSDVAGLIKTYDVQVASLSTHLERLKELGDQAGKFISTTEKALTLSTDSINTFSGTIQNSVSKQAESLALMTKEIDQQLPKALGELEKVLTSITNQFAADYRSLFQFITDKR
ncbi:MAG: hypothetical protein J0M12_07360 [Deltaproteobacteria bacterium]|nr:hypothetical protein [Deltaproteobacteria bacterium]